MGKVQARDIHARLGQHPQAFKAACGGAYRTNNLGSAHGGISFGGGSV